MWRLVLVVSVGLARPVDASPSPAVEGSAGGRVGLISGTEVLGRVSATVSERWAERWHAGVHLSADLSRRTQIYGSAGEIGVWLHPSAKFDVLLGYRIGYANFRFEGIVVHAFAAESIAKIVFPMSGGRELHVSPLTIEAYLSDVWQFTIGPEVGLAWRW